MISANCVAERDRSKGLPVLLARQFIGAATTALSLITGAFLLALAAGHPQAQGPAPVWEAAGPETLQALPDGAWKGGPRAGLAPDEKTPARNVSRARAP